MPSEESPSDRTPRSDELEREANRGQPGLVAEFFQFLLHEKKWWLIPIVLMLLILSLIVVLAGTVGPFIYPF